MTRWWSGHCNSEWNQIDSPNILWVRPQGKRKTRHKCSNLHTWWTAEVVWDIHGGLLHTTDGEKAILSTNWIEYPIKVFIIIHSSPEDESCCLWWSPDFSSSVSMRLTVLYFSGISQQVLAGWPWNFVQTFVIAGGWFLISLVISWCFI